jgi:hypothetical protein
VSSSDAAIIAEHHLSPAVFFILVPVRNHWYVFCFYMMFCILCLFCLFCFVFRLWRRAAVGCFTVDGCDDHLCTDVLWLWRIPNRNADDLLTTINATANHTTKVPGNNTTTYDVHSAYTGAMNCRSCSCCK